MSALAPFEVLVEGAEGAALPLPPALAALYGPLALPTPAGRPYVAANFISTLDGVVAYDVPGKPGGGEIGGPSAHDRALMGLLRATADAVVVGAGTLRVNPSHVWTPAAIYTPLAADYQALRAALGHPEPPLTVLVSASGRLDLSLRIFTGGAAPVLIVTTAAGAAALGAAALPVGVIVAEVTTSADGRIPAAAVLAAIQRAIPTGRNPARILVEGGPHLLGDFLAVGLIDEQFLTLAPRIVGRDGDGNGGGDRLGLVAGHIFAPPTPLAARLLSVRRAGEHLFLRYDLAR